MPEKDKKLIQYLSLGVLSREYANRTDPEVSNLCIDCKVRYDQRLVTETTEHIIECSLKGQKLIEELAPIVEEMNNHAHNKIRTSTYCKTIQECRYFLERTIFNDVIDLALGIGKIQQLKDINKSLYDKVRKKLYQNQKILIEILSEKEKKILSYNRRIAKLKDEQRTRVRNYL